MNYNFVTKPSLHKERHLLNSYNCSVALVPGTGITPLSLHLINQILNIRACYTFSVPSTK